MEKQGAIKEVAFYYPGHLWHQSDWIKSLLLFFDGIGLLIPEYKQGEPELLHPTLAEPLRDQGLLHYLVADQVVDQVATEQLATAVTELITSGALDALSKDGTAFHEISMSRMGYYGDKKLVELLFQDLKARGLARESKDGVSIPLHREVRHLILVLLAQILRPKGTALGLDLSPATDRPQVVQALSEMLAHVETPSAGGIVAFDLQAVSVDLSLIPLDEVLSFRTEHRELHQSYARAVRKFARELSLMPAMERSKAFEDRQAEIEALASDLRKTSRRAWKKPASFCLGFAGAAWGYHTGGDTIAALLTLGSVLTGLEGSKDANAFSYLFAANKSYV